MKPKARYHSLFFADLEPGDFPLRVSVETTNHCNLRCPYCPREESGRGFGYMTMSLFESLAAQCAHRDVAFAPQGFGEPFLDPHFGERMLLAQRLGVRWLDVVTNATLMDEAACRVLVDAQVALVTIDIDGADPRVFEAHRKNARYDEVVRNVRRLFAVRDAAGSERPAISLSAVQLDDVLPSMAAFRALWEPLLRADDEIFYAKPVTWGGDRPMPGKRPATPAELRARSTCRMLYKTLQIYFDGRTSPCTYDHACRLHVGDATSQTIAEIWNGEPLRQLRRLHEQRRSEEVGLCRGCPDHMS